MFTGLVVERGRLTRDPWPSGQGGQRLELSCSPGLVERLELGASLAVSGVCLTVVESSSQSCQVELSPETLSRTTLGSLAAGAEVNLEPALRMGDPLGGHWVQGHVDTTTEVVGREDLEEHRELWFEVPEGLEDALVEKGSVTVDGVSLTVAALDTTRPKEVRFCVALIPHTTEVTTLDRLEPGHSVNLEVDVLAKYVGRSLEGMLESLADRLTQEVTQRLTQEVLRRVERS